VNTPAIAIERKLTGVPELCVSLLGTLSGMVFGVTGFVVFCQVPIQQAAILVSSSYTVAYTVKKGISLSVKSTATVKRNAALPAHIEADYNQVPPEVNYRPEVIFNQPTQVQPSTLFEMPDD
jgi:hypothetical protein